MSKIRWIAAGAAMIAVSASLVPGPYASVTASSNGPLFESAQLSGTDAIALQVACGDCHSNRTAWPWYSRVAPFSWMVRKDVSEGRKFLNFSTWSEYGPEGQTQLLVLAAARIRDRTMPPSRYLLLHPEAKVGDRLLLQLTAALEQESARVSKAAQPSP